MPANLENSAVATGLEKVSFYSHPIPTECLSLQQKAMPKNIYFILNITLIISFIFIIS